MEDGRGGAAPPISTLAGISHIDSGWRRDPASSPSAPMIADIRPFVRERRIVVEGLWFGGYYPLDSSIVDVDVVFCL